LKLQRKYHYNKKNGVITYTDSLVSEINQDVKKFRNDLMAFIAYNPDTGEFTRILKQTKHNLSTINKPIKQAEGGKYLSIVFKGRKYKAHRLAWLIHYGEWPKQVIDHINRQPNDNRIMNLRDVSYSENIKNSYRFDK
jgi:cytoplasmic iron level regulating protein YaaA (DUF328/UPF0246 family)